MGKFSDGSLASSNSSTTRQDNVSETFTFPDLSSRSSRKRHEAARRVGNLAAKDQSSNLARIDLHPGDRAVRPQLVDWTKRQLCHVSKQSILRANRRRRASLRIRSGTRECQACSSRCSILGDRLEAPALTLRLLPRNSTRRAPQRSSDSPDRKRKTISHPRWLERLL